VLRKALAKSAADRYPSCTEFVETLVIALNVNPNWHALPRSGAQSMPTMGGAAPVAAGAGVSALLRSPDVVPNEPSTGAFIDTVERNRASANPVLKSLLWMLVGIGLVGLVLFGAQKYLFNRNTEPAAPSGDSQAQLPTSPPDQSASKPSPVGQPRGEERAAKESPKPDTSPDTTAPETTTPAKPASAAKSEPVAESPRPTSAPAPSRSLPPPVGAPKSEGMESIQFVTDPPNAQLIIDGNSIQTCKTPCMLSLSAGRHSLNVQLDGYRGYPRVFNVPQDREIFLQLSKVGGTLSVTSSPAGATIEINGEKQSKATPAIFNFAPGNYRVKVSRNGAFLEFDVQLHDGEFVNKRVDF
jgi:hypothetical protein